MPRLDRQKNLLAAGALAPFGAVTALAWVAVPVGSTIDWSEYAVASVLIVFVGISPLTGWRAIRFGSIASALYGSRRTLGAVIGAVAVFYLAPILLLGPPDYPTAQYRTTLLLVVVSAIIGLTTQGLVSQVKQRAKEARDQRRMLEAVGDLVRDLGSGAKTREEICEAARTIAKAAVAVLYEPIGGDGLRSTAIAGVEADQIEIPSGKGTALQEAFTSGRRILLTEDVEERVGSHELWEATGRPASILDEPLMRGSEVVGVLAVGWNDEVRVDGPRASVVALLAHEAAAVIGRADVLDQLSAAAATDPLTGLPNRRAWDASIKRAFDEHESVTLAILDLDHFKLYNDSFGHPAGDLLLRETAAAWRDQLRGDTIARIGGEEFGLILVDCDVARAGALADRLRGQLPHGQTCSVGIASRAAGESIAGVMARADAALYEAKDGGRDRVAVSVDRPVLPTAPAGSDVAPVPAS
jgi:diguanylate cyclase (GGDEF)-like protein